MKQPHSRLKSRSQDPTPSAALVALCFSGAQIPTLSLATSHSTLSSCTTLIPRGAGRSTLLGQPRCAVTGQNTTTHWIDSKVMLNDAAALPGLPLPSPPPSPSHLQKWRTTMPPCDPLSQTQTGTWTQMHQASQSTLASPGPGSTVTSTVIWSWRRGSSGAGVPTVHGRMKRHGRQVSSSHLFNRYLIAG